jgi:diguanylate cyclase (GGDEF)-like protein
MSDKPKKSEGPEIESGTSTVTRVINPNTDTLKLDMEAAKASDAILIIIRGSPQGKKFVLKGEALTLGRDKSADIQINDPNVSRQHAKILQSENGFILEDLGSRNGTHINYEKMESNAKVNLAKEDMIRMGTTVLKFLPAGELETLYHTNLTNMAYMDKLTEVYNRNYISDVLEAEFKRAKALHTNFSLILFDIDNFKKVNDNYGHDGGDHVLTELARTVKNSGLRERDFVGRYGGEEFLILLTNSSLQQAGEVAERVRRNVESHKFNYEDQVIPVTISIGVSCIGKIHHNSVELYKAADKALYESKHTGKNKVTLAKDS